MAKPQRGLGPPSRPAPSHEARARPAARIEGRPTSPSDTQHAEEPTAADGLRESKVGPDRRTRAAPGLHDGRPATQSGDEPRVARETDGDQPREVGSVRQASSRRADEPAAEQTIRPAASHRRWPWIAALILVLGVGMGWWMLHRRGNAPEDASKAAAAARVPVEVAEAKSVDLPLYLDGLGSVQAFNTVVVRSRVDGEIQKIAFKEGQMVQAGDLLAQIDARPYQAVLDQAIAKKAQDEATQASNRTDLGRTQELATRGFAPRQQVDQQTATVGAITAQIAMDQAMIQSAETQLGYTTIRAPIAGRTGLRLVDQGNIVRASDQAGIVEIAEIDPIAVVFTAPEQQLPDIARAMRDGQVEVTALRSDGKGELGRGTLSLINNEVDQASGTVRLKAAFDNAGNRLWPGLSVNTRLLVRKLKAVVAIPENAVQRGPKDLFVFVVKDGAVEMRNVKIGPFTEGQAVVEDGLTPGEQVVTAGQSRLKAGTKVDTGAKPEDVAKNAGAASPGAASGAAVR